MWNKSGGPFRQMKRLHLYIKRTRTALLILDVRVGSTVVANSQWEDGGQETDLIIVGNRIVMRAFDLECASAPMATVSVRHALSKRYRRGFNNSDESVMADLAVLAQHQMPDAPTPRVSVTSPSGGLWCGDVMRFHDIDGVESLILAVRTFRSADRFY
jgi:hypothetical protein